MSNKRWTEKANMYFPQPNSIVGIVEVKPNSYDRKLVAGYYLSEKRERTTVTAILSKSDPHYGFDLSTGNFLEPDMENAKNVYYIFRNYPEPVYHWRFGCPPPDNNAFEPHCKTLFSRKLSKLNESGAPIHEIARYKINFTEFLKLCKAIFKA